MTKLDDGQYHPRHVINGGGADIDIRSFNGAILVHKGK